MPNVFATPVFFITFRETLETSIIVSVLLAFLKQSLSTQDDPVTYKKLRRQVWYGVGLGLIICLIIGAAFIGTFYGLGADRWAASEYIWEGVFAMVASIIISIMGAGLLRISKLKAKWQVKLARALEAKEGSKHGAPQNRFKNWCVKYAMFHLPFVTVLREGIEAIVFIGGVGLSQPATAFPLAVICGLAAGIAVGFIIYKGGNMASMQIFLIISTCFLYLIAAGLFSKAIWYFEAHKWNNAIGGDAAETGVGAGSYDIRQSVWHVNCCSPEINGGGGWGVFNSLFGWQNSATYGSVISYNLYWVVIICCFALMRYSETRGQLPFRKASTVSTDAKDSGSSSEEEGTIQAEKTAAGNGATSNVRSVKA
ncbi:uncharacterized protein KY384_006596 [Bacidia gigantensis]|uniref:uncharacterized protein n=1 Tax=Bacidia gigantensis TaxID=2732470 RepID=UPI001D03F0A0|nr:uncharacterized protein KY384_006596 [Bacidia gigantensis]KAG8528907.1 hypothetical protein KY384_006596 [Bacidia gigantensis]